MGGSNLKSADTSLLKVPQYCCDFKGCRKYFNKLSRLKYHQNTHLAEKPYKCSFEGCSSAYYRPNHLKRHVESIHSSQSQASKQYKCQHEGCAAAFDTESSLFFHTKRTHYAEPLKCSFCDKKFSKKWQIKEHEAGHTGGFPFKCEFEECTEEFKGYLLYKAHRRGHEKTAAKDTSLTCSVEGCQQKFEKWSELVIHRRDSHPPETRCQICNKTFTQRNLKLHLPIHSENRQTFQCTFDGCPKFYFHQKNLTHHIKVKHEGNGFNCLLCDRKLSTKQKLLQHIENIHKRKQNPTASQKKKRKSNMLQKLKTMTDEDWKLKKTGPQRYERRKYDFIKFSETTTGMTISSQQQHFEEPCEPSASVTSTLDTVIESRVVLSTVGSLDRIISNEKSTLSQLSDLPKISLEDKSKSFKTIE